MVVLADAGLGPVGLARALRGAAPDHVIGVARGLALARLLGIPGRRILAGRASRALRRLLGSPPAWPTSPAPAAGSPRRLPVDPDAAAAVLFTSGATGPAKGVVYRHGQLQAQLDTLRTAYGITPDDRLVAAFPPFALYGPALGIASATPGCPRTAAPHRGRPRDRRRRPWRPPSSSPRPPPCAASWRPSTGSPRPTARRWPGSAWSSPRGRRCPRRCCTHLGDVLPRAAFHTPYGMTEALPVTDVSLAEIDAAGSGDGVCVGRPLPEVAVRISPLSADGTPDGPLTDESGLTGEVCVRAAHVKDHYDQLWATEQRHVARRRVAPHRRRRAPRRQGDAVGRGPHRPRDHDRGRGRSRRSASSSASRPSTASPPPPSSGWVRGARSRWWSSS